MKKRCGPHNSPGASRDIVEVLGVPVFRGGRDAAVQRIISAIDDGRRMHVIALNVNSIMYARKNRELMDAFRGADLVLPDGTPLLWAARLLGRRITGRVTGTDILLSLCEASARKGWSCFFLGAEPATTDALTRRLNGRFPGLRISGSFSPPRHRAFPARVSEQMRAAVNRAHPDILWVGLGAPKQEIWLHKNLPALQVGMAAGVGAAFDFLGGTVPRAPRIMQSLGLEWFFRFLTSPRRFFLRYFRDAAPFLPLAALQALGAIFGRR